MTTRVPSPSSSVPSANKGSVWTVMPWLLLVGVIAASVWFYIENNGLNQTQWQPTTQQQPTEAQPERLPDEAVPVASYHNAVAKAAQSVVNIYTTQRVTQNPYLNDPIVRRFFEFHGGMPQQDQGATNLGSGVIVSDDGFIVTNAHVIEQADEIIVALNDGRKSRATVIGTDPESDLAVIKVDMTELTPLAFREEPIAVGDVALAIGNPFGVGQTVTQGIISATDRTGLGVNTFEDFIQTDAAINPGNSGGALVDANGALVGINTAIFSRSGGSMGIGFAIPTALVEQVMNALIQDGRVSRGWLGIEVQSQLRDPTQLDTSTGVEVMNVLPDSPSQKSGIQTGDIILSIDGVEMTDANTLIQYVARKLPGTVLETQVLRNDETVSVDITLAERPAQDAAITMMQEQGGGDLDSDNPAEYLNQGNDMSEEERERLREELLQLFERDMARNNGGN